MKMTELEKRFLNTYSDQTYMHTTMVRHNGTLVAFAMGENRRIYYTVLNLDGQDEATIDAKNWLPNPIELRFPNEISQVGFGLVDPKTLPLTRFGGAEVGADPVRPEEIDPFLSSTARLTADAPFQVVSDQKHVYVFRQSIGVGDRHSLYAKNVDGEVLTDAEGNPVPVVNETLLVDRFILVGTQLRMTREVRFRRSRNKVRPLNSKDSLGAKDMNDRPFFEPTQELEFVRNLKDGRFTVLQLPTQIADVKQWQIFAHNSQTDRIDAFTIERAKDGGFNTQGSEAGSVNLSKVAESALKLDGVDDYVALGPVDIGTTFTAELWVKPTAQDSDTIPEKLPSRVVLSAIAPDGTDILTLGYYNDELGATVNGAVLPTQTGEDVSVRSAIADWHPIALTVESTTETGVTVTVYQNGELVCKRTLRVWRSPI